MTVTPTDFVNIGTAQVVRVVEFDGTNGAEIATWLSGYESGGGLREDSGDLYLTVEALSPLTDSTFRGTCKRFEIQLTSGDRLAVRTAGSSATIEGLLGESPYSVNWRELA